MKITIPVNHNFHENSPILESDLCDAFSLKKSGIKNIQNLFSSVYELKLGTEKSKNIKILSFKKRSYFEPDNERLILKLYSKDLPGTEKRYFIQTGLYAGTLYYKGCKINITSKYGDSFLTRMLNFVNDIYIDNEQVKAKKDEHENQFLFIIAHLFIQAIEKAAILGLPQEYKRQQERTHKVRGTIDFNSYLKQDIPFQGKLTSIFKERCYVQEIIDVLYFTVKKLERYFGKEIHNRLLGINQLLKQHYSGRHFTYETIKKAKAHKVISNSLYGRFKQVLEYAEIILLDKDLIPNDANSSMETTGYLFDIAELFELYIEKLLSRNFNDWSVNAQENIYLYQNTFYKRSMFPDIVMKHRDSNKVAIFDAKFKNMEMYNNDVDRNDLHQIHSYIGYYHSEVIAGGLLYPLSREIDTKKAHSDSLFGAMNNKIKFIIDGIYVNEKSSMAELIQKEEQFIERIKLILDTNQTINQERTNTTPAGLRT
ncbi:MAG: McrC family protein [Candidatus Thiothrix sulfatifontis]|nr:MAG: McrC family protein [Candidatus Thiothrix sulfatifontis]